MRDRKVDTLTIGDESSPVFHRDERTRPQGDDMQRLIDDLRQGCEITIEAVADGKAHIRWQSHDRDCYGEFPVDELIVQMAVAIGDLA